MRRHDDVIEVTCDRDEAPSRFTWRGALWRVLAVENRWNETGAWWAGRAARLARGELDERADDGFDVPDEGIPAGHPAEGEGDSDLLDEVVVWRVEAANGMPGSRGVYELAHAPTRAQWRLRGVLD